MSLRRYGLLAIAAAISASCASEPAGPADLQHWSAPALTVTTTGSGTATVVHLRIINASPTAYSYGSCTLWIERFDSGAWVRVGDPDAPCPADIRIVAAWQSQVSEYHPGQSLPTGSYRITITFGKESEPTVQVVRSSNAFDWLM
jgi:hypothetical protein